MTRAFPAAALGAALVLAAGAATRLAAQQRPAADRARVAAAPGDDPPTRAGWRLLLGYSGNFPRQPLGGTVMLLHDGIGLYADARTTVPDPGFSKEVPVITADTIMPAPGYEKELRFVYLSWSAGLTFTRGRWGGYAAAGRTRRRAYLLKTGNVDLFSEVGEIWGEDRSRRRDEWAGQAGIIRELAPGAFVFAGAQSRPLGGTFGFALALNGRGR